MLRRVVVDLGLLSGRAENRHLGLHFSPTAKYNRRGLCSWVVPARPLFEDVGSTLSVISVASYAREIFEQIWTREFACGALARLVSSFRYLQNPARDNSPRARVRAREHVIALRSLRLDLLYTIGRDVCLEILNKYL